MGVDLALVPIDSLTETNGKVCGYGFSLLQLKRQRELWDRIDAMKPDKLPKDARAAIRAERFRFLVIK